jgi:hypothetical protein
MSALNVSFSLYQLSFEGKGGIGVWAYGRMVGSFWG